MKHLKNNHNKLVGFVLLSLFILCSACKRDCQDPTNPKCENYDPCYGKEKPSAKFVMEEGNTYLANKGIWYADSAFFGAQIRFRSELTDNRYKHTWYVGAETFNGHTTPGRNFLSLPRPQNITISHVIEYTPDLQCFPNDIGKDSVAQTFTLIASRNTDFKTYGTYRGVLEGTVDSFDVQIISIDQNGQLANINTHVQNKFINFHNLGDTIYGIQTSNRISGFFYNHHGFFDNAGGLSEGSIKIDADGNFVMTYRGQDEPMSYIGDSKLQTFKGRILP